MSTVDKPSHGEREHAEWAPSSAGRWLACPMSVDTSLAKLPKVAPAFWRTEASADDGNFHTARGTAIHEEADCVLQEFQRSGIVAFRGHADLKFTDPSNGKTHRIKPAEWLPHVKGFVYGCLGIYGKLCDEHGEENVQLFNETRVNVWGAECWGSTDCAIVAPGILHVIDLKAGHGLVAADSEQNRTYACGLFRRFSTTQKPIKKIYLHIAQQANEANDGWITAEVTPSQLKYHFESVKTAINDSKAAKSAGRLPTEQNINSYCNFCPKFTICPAHHDRALKALEAADLEGDTVTGEIENLPVNKLSALVGLAGPLRELLKAAEAELMARTEAGEDTGYKIVEGRSQRKWDPAKTEEEIVAELAEAAEFLDIGYEPYAAPKLRSFTDAEKILGKGMVDGLTIAPPGKPALVPATDPREPINLIDVLKD